MHGTESRRDAYFREPRGILSLGFAIFAGPVAWSVVLTAGYSLVAVSCDAETTLPLHLLTAVMLLVSVAGVVVARREWRRAGRGWPGEGGDVLSRSRFAAVLGLLSSGLFALVIVAQWLAVLLLDPCMGI